jgi:spermidine/putrescine transport system permease protein
MLVLAYVWVPFVALPIFVSLDNMDRSLLEAAADLGASRLGTFWRVTLRMSIPGVVAAFVFVFVPTIGEFVTPQLVGGTNGYLFGNAISDLFTQGLDWQSGSALAFFFVILVVFLYAPIALLTLFAFNDGDVSFPLQGFTTHWFTDVLRNDVLMTALVRSAVVATVSSLIAVTLGVLSAFALLRRRFRGKPVASALMFSPLVVPYLVFGISLLLLFTLIDKGLTAAFGSYIGFGLHTVVIGHVVVSLPYTILTVMPLLERLSLSLDEAAKDLGASPWQTFRRVTLPLLMPALVSAFLISFTLSFDEYAIASFLAGTSPTWPVYLFGQLRVPSQLPQLVAVSSVVFIGSLLLVVSAEVGRRLMERRYGSEYVTGGL